jgi:glycosyltransferase involved in cell wall biosynthesis
MWCLILNADRFVAISSDIAQELEAQGVTSERIARIPNGVDANRFSPLRADQKEQLRQELGLPRSAVLAICATRLLRRQKGLDVLLAAWQRLVSEGGDVYLVLLGDGQDRSELESEARELGLTEHVGFVGWRENPETYLAACDLFVLASRSEGLPNALLEAMACGLPVVATQVSGSRDVINDQVGYLVPVEDVGALATRLRHMIEAPELRRQMSANARRLVETRYSIRRTADQHIALYQELARELKP